MSQMQAKRSDLIDGYQYDVYMLDPLTATDLIADLSNILSPMIGALATTFAGKEVTMASLLDTDVGKLASELGMPLQDFFAKFPKDKQREFILQLSKVTNVVLSNGDTPSLSNVFSEHFRGRTKSLYKWFFFCLKSQFSDFFSQSSEGINPSLRPEQTS